MSLSTPLEVRLQIPQDKGIVADFKGIALHALTCRAATPCPSEGLRLLLLPVQLHGRI